MDTAPTGPRPARHHMISLAEATELTSDQLGALAWGDALAIRVARFVEPAVSGALANWISAQRHEPYHVVADRGRGSERFTVGVDRIGIPLNELAASSDLDEAIGRYLASARVVESAIAAACRPWPAPMATLQRCLARAWPAGARPVTVGGQQLFVGIPRIVAPFAHLLEAQPHVDAVHPQVLAVDHQISANIYLTVPDAGGELQIWPIDSFSTRELFSAPIGARLQRAALGEPCSIAPRPGELVIINSRRPHAVSQFAEGKRVSIQCFIGVPMRADLPLTLWS